MSQIVRPDTAFSTSPVMGQRRPRRKLEGHLAWLRTLPCLISGVRPVDAAHIRYSDRRFGKRETGKSEKPHDIFAVPLHRSMHDIQHSMGEREFWLRHRIDPVIVAVGLWINSGDDEMAEVIMREARVRGQS